MAELAGLVIGVVGLLPVAAQALQGYGMLREALYQCRECTAALRSVEVQIQVQEGRFRNNSELILHSVAKGYRTNWELRAMIENPEHILWTDVTLNDRLRQILSRNYGHCESIIESTQETIQDVQNALYCFDIIRAKRQKEEPLKQTFKRLRQSLRIVLDKSWYQKKIDRLRTCNEDLEALRCQIAQFQQLGDPTKDVLQSLPPSILEVREISSDAFNAIMSAFTCTDLSHTSHSAAVGVQTTRGDSGQRDFDIAIAYMSTIDIESKSVDKTFMHLRLEARAVTSPVIHNGDEVQQMGSSLAHMILSEGTTYQKRGTQNHKIQSHGPGNKGPKVQSLGRGTSHVPPCHVPGQPNKRREDLPQEVTSTDLCLIDDCCEYMRVKHDAAQRSLEAVALGFVDGPRPCRHSFVFKTQNTSNAQCSKTILSTPPSLRELIVANHEDDITLDFQLEIALRVASAALQFHSTPWLRDIWDMSDLYMLESIPHDLSDIRMYLQAELPVVGAPAETTANQPWMSQNEPERAKSFSLADYHGINKMILFSLGVALIEIGHWRTLIGMKIDNDPEGIPTARRLARRPTPLGGTYQEIVQRCLQCNFGYGTDLKRYELQDAVYAKVVCPLEKLRKQSQIAFF